MTVNGTEKGVPAQAGAAAPEAVPEAGTATEAAEPAAARAAAEAAAPDPETARWSGPARWAVPALATAVGLLMVWGALTVQAPPNATRPGPGFFPGVIGGLLLVSAVCLVVTNLRGRATGAANALEWFEARPVLIVLAGLVAHIALLEFLGWLAAGALLFWAVAFAFGARAYLRDAVVALSVSAAVQVGFSLGLGLSLPGGILELVL
ncbi:tripartite tricarboxylate transporter TctB family protein [Nocardiopsis sp. CC223A]|uniref:tripartite tricarboxylate transporter TctB family protein n=1 Tax=Nocardiopsis sp. CC223A TaxID=3044051 RepID=UPI00278C580C|nr:tripartite tricarboxylate transporter TctB family protein [Nocardiopsis sp. CC223A]